MTADFVQSLSDLMEALAGATPDQANMDCRRFFGGAAAYVDGRIFMSQTPVGLAVKLSAEDRTALMNLGGTPLRYFPKAPIKKAYVVVPPGMAADAAALAPWTARSMAYVLTLPKPARKTNARKKKA